MRVSLKISLCLFVFFIAVLNNGCKKDPPKVIPTLTTSTVSNVTSTSATTGGSISSDGNSAITARGVCWSENQNPTISNSKTTDGSGIGVFSSFITELTPGKTYYLRAYATNSIGTAYGNQISFATNSTFPSITTVDITNISSSSATSGGNILQDGGSLVTSRGVCWSITQNPTTKDSITNNGTGIGLYSSVLNNLIPGTTYYVRAYAINGAGLIYGNQLTFNTAAVVPTLTTTDITEVTPESAESGGNVSSSGGSEITVRGICWSTKQSPTISDSKTIDDLNTTTYKSVLNNLLDNTTYYVRAYATNSVGTGYGNEISFKTTNYSTESEFKPTGMLPSTQEEIESIPTVESSNILNSIIVKSSNATRSKFEIEVPTSYNQLYYQNCVAAAVGYGMMSILFKQIHGYENFYGDDKIFSPFYIWNQLNAGGTNTSLFCSISRALKLVNEQGCCKLTDMPLTTIPSSSPSLIAKSNASLYKLSVYRFEKYNISTYKSYLSEGYPIVIGVFLDNTFITNGEKMFDKKSDGRLVWNTYYDNIKRTGHAMLICGYDDEINAFKVLNSWGQNWANDGCFWIDYDFLKEALKKDVHIPLFSNEVEVYVGIVKRPFITTKAVSEITNSGAKCGGEITKDWNNFITSKGICWSSSPDPTVLDNKTTDGSGKESFLSTISGLNTGTKYYVKAYAINSEGISYGKQESFTTNSSQTPTVTTSQITTYTSTSATVGGNVTHNGGSLISDRGIYYSTNILLNGTKLQIGTGTGVFSTNLTGLTPNTTYYIKAYATNSAGTSYGSTVTFKTDVLAQTPTVSTALPTDVSLSGATLGGNVTSAGSSNVTERGIVYSTTQNPTTSNFKVLGGSGIGVYSMNVTGLTADRLYYVRAYAINSQGTAYGSQVSFYTGLEPVAQFIASPLNINVNESVQFTDQSSNSPTSWNWDFGDGGISTIQNPSHTYSTAGTYTVTLTVTNSHGSNTFTRNNYITVNEVSGNTVTDIDGNVYNTVTIGSQIWMKENLKTTRYRNGDLIGTTSPATLDISSQSNPKYQWAYNGNESNVSTYGRLYTWYAVTDSRNICPTGWHVPTDEEWTTLTTFLGGENVAGGKLKESGTTHWQSPNTGATNSSGFAALPGGLRFSNGIFGNIDITCYFWCKTEYRIDLSWFRSLHYDGNFVYKTGDEKNRAFSIRCIKGESFSIPSIMTNSISNITSTSSTSGGNITSNGGAPVTARGVCWSTNHNPTISNSKTTDGTGNGSFTSSISGLVENTTYYVRAYATNSQGTAYGNEVSFITTSSSGIIFNPNLTYGSVTDIDGNVYKTIQIGTQVWMAENLKVTKYNNGDVIPTTTKINEFISPYKYQWPCNMDENELFVYGRLYTGYVLQDTRNVCPNGWHVPTVEEWQTLGYFVGGIYESSGGNGMVGAGAHLKEVGTLHWVEPNSDATNKYGLTALPGGWIYSLNSEQKGLYGSYFTSTTSYWNGHKHHIDFKNDSGTLRVPIPATTQGHNDLVARSIRCVKD